MSELIVEIVVYLGIAGLIGFLLGFLVWGWGQAARIANARADGAATARTSVDGDAGLHTRLAECQKERKRLEIEVERLGKRLIAAESTRKPSAPSALPPATPDASGPAENGHDGSIQPPRPAETPPPPVAAAAALDGDPEFLLAERPDEVDDLKQIKGVGKVMEGVLNEKGIYLFRQIAELSESDIAWVNSAIEAFPGRIERDDWVGQAQALYDKKYGPMQD